MIIMKIVVHQNRDTRKVINTSAEQRLIVLDRRSQLRSYAASSLVSSERHRHNSFQEIFKEPRYRYTTCRKHSQRKKRDSRYHMKRDLAMTKKKFARLSVNVSTPQEEESIKNSTESSVVQLREPVLQFSRSYEKSTSSNASDGSSTLTEKTDQLAESMIEIYKCKMCPNFTIPEVYECSSGHTACNECYLILDECTLCSKESSFRRVLGMERIASFLKFPCRWHQRGCLELLDSVSWRNHVDWCNHAEVHLNPLTSASQVGNSSNYEIDDEDL